MSKRNSVRADIGDVSTVKAKSRAGRSSSKRLLGGVVITTVVMTNYIRARILRGR